MEGFKGFKLDVTKTSPEENYCVVTRTSFRFIYANIRFTNSWIFSCKII